MDRRSRYVLKRYTSPEAMKADEYAYWQSRPPYERMEAVAELTAATYGLKGRVSDEPRLQRTLVRIKR